LLAYSLAFSLAFKHETQKRRKILDIDNDALDAYDKKKGWIVGIPTQEAIDEHRRDMSNA
jgi:hypothetical protein